MSFKTTARRVGTATVGALCLMAEAQNQARIDEIDAQIAPLQERINELNARRAELTAWR